MRELIERLKAEKKAINKEKAKRHHNEAEGREHAYVTGVKAAKTWIQNASYQEIKEVLRRGDGHKGAKRFALKRNIFFTWIEKACPDEAREHKWLYNDSFMNGWREGVSLTWESIRNDVDGK